MVIRSHQVRSGGEFRMSYALLAIISLMIRGQEGITEHMDLTTSDSMLKIPTTVHFSLTKMIGNKLFKYNIIKYASTMN